MASRTKALANSIPSQLSIWVLGGWLIAVGLLSLLHLVNPTTQAVLDIVAIVAGALVIFQRR